MRTTAQRIAACTDPEEALEAVLHHQARADATAVGPTAQHHEAQALKWKQRLLELGGPPGGYP